MPPLARRDRADHPHRRALARAVRAEEAERLATRDGELDPVDGDELAVELRELAGLDQGSPPSAGPRYKKRRTPRLRRATGFDADDPFTPQGAVSSGNGVPTAAGGVRRRSRAAARPGCASLRRSGNRARTSRRAPRRGHGGPRGPIPRRRRSAAAIVGDLDHEDGRHEGRCARSPTSPARTSRCSSATRRRRSTRRSRRAGASAAVSSMVITVTEIGARPASARTAGPRPWTLRICGWSPRASSRSSSCAVVSSTSARSRCSSARVGVGAERSRGEVDRVGDGDEVLLGAVVEVPLEALPLGVAGGDDACARAPDLLLDLLARRHVEAAEEIAKRALGVVDDASLSSRRRAARRRARRARTRRRPVGRPRASA